jgi:hypothetical protein
MCLHTCSKIKKLAGTILVTLEVLPFCTYPLVHVVLPWLEGPPEVFIWYGSEICSLILLNILRGRKTTNFEPKFDPRGKAEVSRNEIWKIWWVKSSSSSKNAAQWGSCGRVHCHGAGLNSLSVFWPFPPNGVFQTFQNSDIKRGTRRFSHRDKFRPHWL